MNNKVVIAVASAVVVLLVGVAVWLWMRVQSTEQEMQQVVEQLTYEKEALEEEYADLSIYEGIEHNLQNDSILKLLDTEKQRVQMLLEELRQTKATNARRIAELKKELASVRKVMVSYIAQIDSLNRINTFLVQENKDIKSRYSEATQTVEQLSQEKEHLTEKVKLASLLEVRDITVLTLTERERKTSSLRKIALMKFSFVVNKNITAPTGVKDIYLRITAPDERVFVKSDDALFAFEGSNIGYSCKKQFEYTGEEVEETLYWKVSEMLIEGTYRVDVFIDGSLVGSKQFQLK